MSSSLSASDAALLALRPPVSISLPEDAPADTVGSFLHLTLRPVLKLQNLRLLAAVADFVHDHRIAFVGAGPREQERVVAELLTRNTKLRYTIVGLVTGLFTEAETAFYRLHRAELNRRLLELAVRRAQDQTEALAQLLRPE
ncbi:hypothetical protein HNQ93_000698 [Hymenobacter luteus]|uniref:Glyoxalase n=2 Tax=Hymenobacter TaxID=89966 RepID=A0A7W9SYK0_9BACT|nr:MULTISPECIES: hypothetical protein [Hymenobacter]MBB4599822.1 hypothetical protein [Hymenobacter latericoloratus]MBB6057868.1 hypothetical protein [Hymenobacter luteus]